MKYILLFSLIILSSINAYAASPVWKIEKNGHSLYLAGTIHLLRPTDYPLPTGFETAYSNASTIVFETDIEALKSPESSQRLINAVQLPKGEHLFQHITPKTQQLLRQYSQINNIPLANLSRFKPSFVAITLALIELRKMGVNQTGVDEYYNQKAIKDRKTTLALETIEQQINFLSTMAKGYEDEFIAQTLKDVKEINTQFNDMLNSWREGDLKKLELFFITPTKKQFPSIHKQLLADRNQNWMPHLKHYLTTPEVEMVLVGSAHLAGDDGLLNILKTDGYKITQLN